MQTFLGNVGLAKEWAEFQRDELMRTRDNFKRIHPNKRGGDRGEDRQIGGCSNMLRSLGQKQKSNTNSNTKRRISSNGTKEINSNYDPPSKRQRHHG